MKKTIRILSVIALLVVAGATTVRAAKVWNETPADPVRPERTGDPAEDAVRREMLTRVPELRTKPAPFLKLDIPDPLELPRTLGLKEFPADNDTPAAATGTPARPVLPVNAK